MFKNGAYYNSIGPALKEYFGKRAVKVSIDAGFTCPNRDGTCGTGGCIFCSEEGSGDFTGAKALTSEEKKLLTQKSIADMPTGSIINTPGLYHIPYKYDSLHCTYNPTLYNSLQCQNDTYIQDYILNHQSISAPTYKLRDVPKVIDQIDAQIITQSRKWQDFVCIAYFQNFTNTYAPLEILRQKYEEALSHPACRGIAIATRPDCLSEEILDYLSELNKKTFLWVELGLQTSNDNTAEYINRGYPLKVYDNSVDRLIARGIRVVTHVIFGLPGENRKDMLATVSHVCSREIYGIKIQLLHIIKDSRLGAMYLKQQSQDDSLSDSCAQERIIRPLEKDEYISLVADALQIIPPEVTIHRLTGDAPKELLLAPLWSRDKRSVLNAINMELKSRR